MKNTSTFLFTILIFVAFFSSLIAQSDNCETALELTQLDHYQSEYSLSDASFDVVNGNCVIPYDTPNMWFKFTAQGATVEIDAAGETQAISITLGKFSGVDCESNDWMTELCGIQSLEFYDLEIGEEYFIVVNKFIQGGSDAFTLSINNPVITRPINDKPCGAIALTADSTCIDGTNVDASPSFRVYQCDNRGYYEPTVWYSVIPSTGNTKLNISMSGLNDGKMVVTTLNDGCDAIMSRNVIAAACSPPYELEIPIASYQKFYIGVSSSAVNVGNFSVCAVETAPPAGCSESNLCSNAYLKEIPTPLANGASQCISDCNIGSSPSVMIPTCIPSHWTATYYQVNTDSMTTRLSVVLADQTADMDAVAIALMNDCNSYIVCEQGRFGNVNLSNITVHPRTRYTILVATPAERQSSNFDICVSSFVLEDEYCIGRNDDTTSAYIKVLSTSENSPLHGPFSPGERVDFEMFIEDYSLTTSQQWLQAIIPVFGTGWSSESFDKTGQPVISAGPNSVEESTWNWYEEENVHYNGNTSKYSLYTDPLGRLAICYFTDPVCPNTTITADTGLPAGWYAYRPGGGPECPSTGHPDDGFGDGKVGPWVVRFSLFVRDFEGEEGCEETGYIDCSVKMFTMSDEQIGCWTGGVDPNACSGDEYKHFKAVSKCCASPVVTTENKIICNGSSTSLVHTSDMDGTDIEVDYSWDVVAPSSVTGAREGHGDVIDQVLVNHSDSIQVVTYMVTTNLPETYCPGNPTSVTVSVLPELQVDAGNDIHGCAHETFNLGEELSISGGSGAGYSYEWNNGLENIASPTTIVNSTTRYSVTITDPQGCSVEDDIVVHVSDAFVTEVKGDLDYCSDENYTELTAEILSGDGNFNYFWDGPVTSHEKTIKATAGVYTLKVDAGSSCVFTSEEITVEELEVPVAAFDYNVVELTCNFEAPSIGGASYLWDFGDGEVSTAQSPQHTYNDDNDKIVSLTIVNECGRDSISQNISLETTEINELSSKFKIFPNPFNDEIVIHELGSEELTQIELYTLDGRKIDLGETRVGQRKSYRINASQLTPGSYFLKLTSDHKTYFEKLIKF